MFQLNYKTSDEHIPDHDSKISYYVLNNCRELVQSLHPKLTKITYEWYSDNWEANEYYNPETESNYKIGDTRKYTYYDETCKGDHEFVRLRLCFDGQPFNGKPDDDDYPLFAWEYTHDIQRTISVRMGVNYFPCFDINNLLREGLVTPLVYEKVLVGGEGNQWYHVYGIFEYKGSKYNLKLSQDCVWKENDWTEEMVSSKVFGKVDVFMWDKLC